MNNVLLCLFGTVENITYDLNCRKLITWGSRGKKNMEMPIEGAKIYCISGSEKLNWSYHIYTKKKLVYLKTNFNV